MGIEVKITADSVVDLHDQISRLLMGAALTSDESANEPQAEPEPPAKRGRAKKGQISEPGSSGIASDEGNASADTAADGTASTTTEAGPSTAPTADTSSSDEPVEVTYADVQKAVTSLAAAKGRDAVVTVFRQFGVDHGTKLTPEQWAPAIDALTAAKEAA